MRFAKQQQNRLKVHVPLAFVARGGRKTFVIDTPPAGYIPFSPNQPLVKALAKAYRWRGLIENGTFSSITELARAQHVNQSYACRILRLTLLAPAVVQDALNGMLPKHIALKDFTKPLPLLWSEQAKILRSNTHDPFVGTAG
jgi:hypothetical protein